MTIITKFRNELESINLFYQVENVTGRVYRISMPYVCCYLIVGENKAVLLDAGWGYGDLKAVVESITDLPVTLVLSHGHPDHVGSASQFETAYLNARDFEMVEAQSQISLRRRLMLRSVPKGFKEEENLWQPARKVPYTPLTEETIFDLGGLTILPFNLPGHSAGSMVFILPEERIAIFGDAISHPTLMYFENSSSVKEHYEAMVTFSSNRSLFDRVLVNHQTYEINKVVLKNNIELAKAVIEGADEKVRLPSRLERAVERGPLYAARERKRWLPSDPKEMGNIYYRADRIL